MAHINRCLHSHPRMIGNWQGRTKHRHNRITDVFIQRAIVFLDLIGDEPRFMPHLHLSLQHGDDMILKRMKRRHAREDSIAFCAELRARRPGIVFGADIIAGFPTETEAMFQRSLDLVEECGLTFLHVFPFSPRKGTPAAKRHGFDKPRLRKLNAMPPCAAAQGEAKLPA